MDDGVAGRGLDSVQIEDASVAAREEGIDGGFEDLAGEGGGEDTEIAELGHDLAASAAGGNGVAGIGDDGDGFELRDA